jgi:hypothetical protein
VAALDMVGTEEHTVELTGRMPAERARGLTGPGMVLRLDGGAAVVGLLLIRMRRMVVRAFGTPLPAPPADYGEALWRIGVLDGGGGPAWFGVTCDLDGEVVRHAGRLLVRYPVRPARIGFTPTQDGCAVEVGAAGHQLRVQARARAEQPPLPPWPLFVRSAGKVWRIPWSEEPAPWRRTAVLEVSDTGLAMVTLGAPVTWGPGLVHRGRIHRCGLAVRVA